MGSDTALGRRRAALTAADLRRGLFWCRASAKPLDRIVDARTTGKDLADIVCPHGCEWETIQSHACVIAETIQSHAFVIAATACERTCTQFERPASCGKIARWNITCRNSVFCCSREREGNARARRFLLEITPVISLSSRTSSRRRQANKYEKPPLPRGDSEVNISSRKRIVACLGSSSTCWHCLWVGPAPDREK